MRLRATAIYLPPDIYTHMAKLRYYLRQGLLSRCEQDVRLCVASVVWMYVLPIASCASEQSENFAALICPRAFPLSATPPLTPFTYSDRG